MRPFFIAATAAITICANSIADAQDSYDTYMHAAYCLGVQNAVAAQARQFSASVPKDTQLGKLEDKTIRDAEEKISRLRAYVLPLAAASGDSTAAAIAATRGGSDVGRIFGNDADLAKCSNTCIGQVGVPQTDLQRQQLEQCSYNCNPDLISHVRSCNDLSWLPF